jgi:hypothetical protein
MLAYSNRLPHNNNMRPTCLNVGVLVFLGVWIGGVIALLVGHMF